MLATILCGPSAWATDTPALVKKPVVKKSGTVAQATKPIKTEIQPAVQSDKSIQSEQASNPIAPNPTTVTASEKGVPVEVDSEDKVKSAADNAQPIVFKTMVIQQKVERDTRYTSPIVRITRDQIELQNAQTVEEAVKFMPSLQIRQRFPGDPNGIMAIRGSDMFATGRNMVFVDGMPIHNFLQASFNGASCKTNFEIERNDIRYSDFGI